MEMEDQMFFTLMKKILINIIIDNFISKEHVISKFIKNVKKVIREFTNKWFTLEPLIEFL